MFNRQRKVCNFVFGAILGLSSVGSYAHDVWIKPDSYRMFSDEQTRFSFDVSRSAEPFVAESNHNVKSLMVFGPGGGVTLHNPDFSGETKEVFEVGFNKYGTYFLKAKDTQVFLSFYEDKNGKEHKIRMAKDEKGKLPAGATLVKTIEKVMSSESYVSFNAITKIEPVIKDKGITIVPLTHPNEIELGEPVKFKIYLNGAPLEDGEVALKSNGGQYYGDEIEIELEGAKGGVYEFEVDKPGAYILGVESQFELKNDKKADFRSIETFLTFDVQSQQ
ncbi:DUF4198 domain-containing protein [uncultured Pseudoteredinibacter sp.]|uniref:DUF4198 domain-containing protein n=1 Tax=uncultured Pseudoteredinibacter sp. TaxID=1641701 RepID=UPI00262F58B7|nr:DUF4198 domain-containing protein [uncultured Pseudoteredinibacter sp.]